MVDPKFLEGFGKLFRFLTLDHTTFLEVGSFIDQQHETGRFPVEPIHLDCLIEHMGASGS